MVSGSIDLRIQDRNPNTLLDQGMAIGPASRDFLPLNSATGSPRELAEQFLARVQCVILIPRPYVHLAATILADHLAYGILPAKGIHAHGPVAKVFLHMPERMAGRGRRQGRVSSNSSTSEPLSPKRSAASAFSREVNTALVRRSSRVPVMRMYTLVPMVRT